MSKAKDKRERAAAEDVQYEDDFGGSGRGGGDGSKPKDDENSPTGNEDYYEVNERRGASDSRLVTTQKEHSIPSTRGLLRGARRRSRWGVARQGWAPQATNHTRCSSNRRVAPAHFEALGVTTDATDAQLKRAYRLMSLKVGHPVTRSC